VRPLYFLLAKSVGPANKTHLLMLRPPGINLFNTLRVRTKTFCLGTDSSTVSNVARDFTHLFPTKNSKYFEEIKKINYRTSSSNLVLRVCELRRTRRRPPQKEFLNVGRRHQNSISFPYPSVLKATHFWERYRAAYTCRGRGTGTGPQPQQARKVESELKHRSPRPVGSPHFTPPIERE
jgi:hypothetical protein